MKQRFGRSDGGRGRDIFITFIPLFPVHKTDIILPMPKEVELQSYSNFAPSLFFSTQSIADESSDGADADADPEADAML